MRLVPRFRVRKARPPIASEGRDRVRQSALPGRVRFQGGRATASRGHPGYLRQVPRAPMKIDQFLKHHGIAGNPFSEEDAQTDTVFKRGCLGTIHHPAWDKFFGSPADPSTALVFGEKGSGKTALRLQATAELEAYNDAAPRRERVFVISYDDFNPLPRPLPRPPSSAKDAARGPDALAAPGPHGRHPRPGRHPAGRRPDGREGRPVRPEPRPAPRPAPAGGPVRPVDRRADRAALEPAPPAVGVPPALEPPRPPDRLRHDAGRRRSCSRPSRSLRTLGVLPWLLVPIAAGLALLGLAAGPRRVVRPRHPQGPSASSAATPPRSAGNCSGSSPSELGGQPLPTAGRDRRRGALRAAPQVPGRARPRSATPGSSS